MTCVTFKVRPNIYVDWTAYSDEQLLQKYKSFTAQTLHISKIGLALFDFLTLDFNLKKSMGSPSAFSPARMQAWLDRFGEDLVDENDDTIVCSNEYGSVFETTDPRWGTLYAHGDTSEFYTTDGKYYGIKDSFYPFNVGLCQKFIPYYDYYEEDGYLGDVYYLPLTATAQLVDGVAGGYYYGFNFELFIAFNQITTLEKGDYKTKFTIRGVPHPFYVYNLNYEGPISSSLPFPKDSDSADSHGYLSEALYLRDAGSDKTHAQDHTFFFGDFDYEYFVETLEAIAGGADEYNNVMLASGKQAERLAARSQHPRFLDRQTRHNHP